jgi:B12-binding domain/radical SAM domain protein
MRIPDLVLLHPPSVFDFRQEAILFGPISDLVPSTPVFEMYPIGFTTMAEYLERHGLRVRIVNLAVRMLRDAKFSVEQYLSRLDAAAFGIDLHWLPHVQGAIEVARLVRRLHPERAIIFGGFSSTYYHEELIRRPEVDFVVRGDSTELPLLELVRYISQNGMPSPAAGSAGADALRRIPNLTWKDSQGQMHANPLTYSPETLDDILLDYRYVLKAVMRHRELASLLPFHAWMRYPITAGLTVRGCRYNCNTCGGSAEAFRRMHGRNRPAFRNPEDLANDLRKVAHFSRGPVFVLGDIRQAGMDYAYRFLDAMNGFERPVIIELFDAAEPEFFQRVAQALPHFTVEVSPESHDDTVRKAFGRPFTTRAIEETMAAALDADCQRLEVFFMIGLPYQTYDSVMGTIDYCEHLMQRFDGGSPKRLLPFISPLAPFLDPGSRAFEEPESHGYRLFCRTLEEHRQASLAPSWKYALNYETEWMDRNEIVAATYEAGRRLNLLKGKYGLMDSATVAATDARIARAVRLNEEIDQIMKLEDAEEKRKLLQRLKAEISTANLSTVCDKRELVMPLRGPRLRWLPAARLALQELLRDVMGG